MQCPNCAKDNADNAQFCAGCGAPLAGDAPAPAPAERLDLPEGQVTASGTSASGIRYEIIGTTLQAVVLTLQPGQAIKVDPGHVAMFEPTVEFDIEMVRGIKTILFGGEGLFLARLRGPGRIWLQTMPMANLVGQIIRYLPQAESGGGGFKLKLGG